MSALLDIPAIAELAAFGARFVYWKHVRDKATGKRRKVPFQWDGKDAAKSNDPATWAALDALLAALPKRRMEGVGVMLGDLGDGRWLVGVDLDLCRSPVTGRAGARAGDVGSTACEPTPRLAPAGPA